MEVESMKLTKKPSRLEKRPSLLLKDFLRDDMSSCSSNGFRSFPRRSCYPTTSIRCLLEIDLKSRDLNNEKQLLRSRFKQLPAGPPKSSSSTTITTTTMSSAFQKASEVMINVVKHFGFSSPKHGISVLPRSFSKRLRRSFWRKKSTSTSCSAAATDGNNKQLVEHQMVTNAAFQVKDIVRWKSFRDLLEDEPKPLDCPVSPVHTTITTTTTTNTNTMSTMSTTTVSWTDSDFTSECVNSSSSGTSEYSGETEDAELCKNYLPVKKVKNMRRRRTTTTKKKNKRRSCRSVQCSDQTVGEEVDSIHAKGENNSEKDQFSPVSSIETKHKLMQKIQRFESLAHLEPVNLDKRISSFELDDSLQSPTDSSSISFNGSVIGEDQEDEDLSKAEENGRKLLESIKETSNADAFKSNEDILLLDFFRDEIIERNLTKRLARGDHQFENGLLNVARDWMNGQGEPLDWGVAESRKVHIRQMERGGNWRTPDEEYRGEFVLEMEVMMFDSLMDELLLDLSS